MKNTCLKSKSVHRNRAGEEMWWGIIWAHRYDHAGANPALQLLCTLMISHFHQKPPCVCLLGTKGVKKQSKLHCPASCISEKRSGISSSTKSRIRGRVIRGSFRNTCVLHRKLKMWIARQNYIPRSSIKIHQITYSDVCVQENVIDIYDWQNKVFTNFEKVKEKVGQT